MKMPRVSICLPNLDNIAYLPERIATIESQSFLDWELVVCDNHSTDGAWEYFLDLARRDSRIRVSQAPREGMYANWNNCIRLARGEFIYMATSDDTMAENCIETLLAALDENPDCDLAHCPMRVIDQYGEEGSDWWSSSSLFARSSGDLLFVPHKRRVPLDGILCMLGDNIYSSVTQLLIRRSLFDRIGLYRTDWGSLGDFHWNLRAGLAASTVHVPDTWGGWRMHPSQATAAVCLNSPDHQGMIDEMIADVLESMECDRFLVKDQEKFHQLEARARELRHHLREHARLPKAARRLFLLRGVISGADAARQHLSSLVFGGKRWPKSAPESVKSWFDENVLMPGSQTKPRF
jgi:hypothetical protein